MSEEGPDDSLEATPGGELQPSEAQQVQLIAAALRADLGDLATYERLLAGVLNDTLPEGVMTVDRDRSLGDRVAGRPGVVRGIQIALGDERLELERKNGRLVAFVTRSVRGVAISHREVGLEEWCAAFARALAEFAKQSERARLALERLLGT